jgi:hypothetical protein
MVSYDPKRRRFCPLSNFFGTKPLSAGIGSVLRSMIFCKYLCCGCGHEVLAGCGNAPRAIENLAQPNLSVIPAKLVPAKALIDAHSLCGSADRWKPLSRLRGRAAMRIDEGPIAQQWEGEGRRRHPAFPQPSHPFGMGPFPLPLAGEGIIAFGGGANMCDSRSLEGEGGVGGVSGVHDSERYAAATGTLSMSRVLPR